MVRRLPEFGLKVSKQQGKGYCLAHPIELLDKQIIEQQLSASSAAALQNLELLNTVDSTNSHLTKSLQGSPFAVSACLAEFQSAGRGRLGRRWVSSYGSNVYLSLAWRFEKDPSQLAGLSLAVAVAVRKALLRYGVPAELGVKWPNDILWQGAKLAGVLLELKAESNVSSQITIGIGVNLQPVELTSPNYSVCSVSEILPGQPRRNEIAGLILDELLIALAQFESEGFKGFIEDWRECDSMREKKVRLITPGKEHAGVVKGISETGELLLEDDAAQTQSFVTGEVSLRTAVEVE
jgi:BirA family biotin operon repressor/biotin-[acetyl-CoA-carboxylase] ligase